MLAHVLREGRASRSQLAARTGLTPGSVSRITQELLDAGLLVEAGTHAPEGKPGRRFVELAAAPGGGYVVGVGIEASGQHAVLADLAGRTVLRRRLRFTRIGDAIAVENRLPGELERVIAEAAVPRSRIFGVGVAVVGVVDTVDGVVIDAPAIGWRHAEIAPRLQAALGLPAVMEGHLNALNLAELRWGLCRGRRNVLLVHTTLGIGASAIAEGALVRGRTRQAGRIAHARVPGATAPCECGRRGCVAAIASGRAVLRSLGVPLPRRHSSEETFVRELAGLESVIGRASEGDTDAVTAVRNAGRALGRFLGAVSAFADPEVILLGGKLGQHVDYASGVRESLAEYQPAGRATEIVTTSMASETAASLLAIDEFACSRPLALAHFRIRRRTSHP